MEIEVVPPATGYAIALPIRACPARDAVRIAVEAEDLGYESIWVPEVNGFDAIALLAAIATVTKQIQLGTGIVPLASRSPALLAMGVATLADLAPSRIILGLGVSSRVIVEEWHGRDRKSPIATMRDSLAIIDQALNGEATNVRGSSLSSHGFRLELPPAARPKIYLAAIGPAMRRLAIDLTDGVILNFLPRSQATVLVAEARSSERSFVTTAFVRVGTTDSTGETERRIRREIASYLRIEPYRRWLDSLGVSDTSGEGHDNLDSSAGSLSDPVVRDVSVMGDVAACQEQLAALRSSGVTPIILPSVANGDMESYRRVMRAMAP